MTSKQPEALRLADWLNQRTNVMLQDRQAAAELRRLHEVEIECDKLKEANQELVEALKEAATSLETISRLAGKTHYVGDNGDRLDTYMGHHDQVRGYATSRAGVARAAIAKHGGAV
jgi:hypothetical protein